MKTIIVMFIITSATHDTAGHAPKCRLSGRMVDDRGGPLFGRAGIVVGSWNPFSISSGTAWGVGCWSMIPPSQLAQRIRTSSSCDLADRSPSLQSNSRSSVKVPPQQAALLRHPDQLITVKMLCKHREMPVAVQRQQQCCDDHRLPYRDGLATSTSWSKINHRRYHSAHSSSTIRQINVL